MTTMHCCPIFAAQSDVPLDIQEVDKSVAVVSYTPPDAEVSQLSVAQMHKHIYCTHAHACYIHTPVVYLFRLHAHVHTYTPAHMRDTQVGYHLLCNDTTCAQLPKLWFFV